jgi:hypothetical protein
MFVPLVGEPGLQQSGPGLVNINTIASAQAVAENQYGRGFRRVCLRAYQQQQQGEKTSHG